MRKVNRFISLSECAQLLALSDQRTRQLCREDRVVDAKTGEPAFLLGKTGRRANWCCPPNPKILPPKRGEQ